MNTIIKRLKPHKLTNVSQCLIGELGFTKKTVKKLFVKHPEIRAKSVDELQDILKVLKFTCKFGTSDIYTNSKLLTKTSFRLMEKYYYLSEGGFRSILPHDLLHFTSLTKKSIKTLKSYDCIPRDENVTRNFYQNIPEVYRNFAIPMTNPDFENDQNMCNISEIVLIEALSSFFDISRDETKKILNAHPRLKRKSFRFIFENLTLCYKTFELSKERIKNNIYLLYTDPEKIKGYVGNQIEIMPTPILNLINKRPYILTRSVKDINDILNCLKSNEISERAVEKCFNIFYLKPSNISSRIQMINEHEQLVVYKQCENAVILISSLHKIMFRLHYCKSHNLAMYFSHNKLLSSDFAFSKYLKDGLDKSRKYELLSYLSEKIDVPVDKLNSINYDSSCVSIRFNPNWKFTNIFTISDNLSYFNNIGYTKDILSQYPVILLYPTNLLVQKVQEVSEMYKIDDKLRILYITHYLIEREYHFSGNAIHSYEAYADK